MSEQRPPFPISPIFNSSYYYNYSGAIDQAYLEANYLQYPLTQGVETFTRSATFLQGANFNTICPTFSSPQNYPEPSTTNLATTNYVNQAVSGVGTPTSLIIPTDPAGNTYVIDNFYDFVLIAPSANSAWTANQYWQLPSSPSLTYYTGIQITIRNNTTSTQIITTSQAAPQYILPNTQTNQFINAVNVASDTSITFIYQITTTSATYAGVWYVI